MKNKEITGNPGQQGEFIVYRGKDDQIKLEVRLQDENIRLTQPVRKVLSTFKISKY